MTRDEVIEYLGDDWTGTLDFMRMSLRSDVALLNTTNESLAMSSGKMLRPIISLLIARAIGQPNEDSRRYAAACELLHNATLMHDDVADESSKRRGRPTVSALLGPSAAVLVGDFWLSKAVELAAHSQHFAQVVKILSKSLTDLAEGEIFQMEKTFSCDTMESEYYRIIRCKTASLFEAAGASAACSVDACEDMVAAAREFTLSYGMAFQIKDDILDYTGTDELGKPLGVDIREKKITLPLLGALLTLPEPERARIRRMVSEVDVHPEYCSELRDFTISAGGIEYASAKLDEFIRRAISALAALPDSMAKDYLEQIARQNAYRLI